MKVALELTQAMNFISAEYLTMTMKVKLNAIPMEIFYTETIKTLSGREKQAMAT